MRINICIKEPLPLFSKDKKKRERRKEREERERERSPTAPVSWIELLCDCDKRKGHKTVTCGGGEGKHTRSGRGAARRQKRRNGAAFIMFESKLTAILQKYLGDYVCGLDKDALKVSICK